MWPAVALLPVFALSGIQGLGVAGDLQSGPRANAGQDARVLPSIQRAFDPPQMAPENQQPQRRLKPSLLRAGIRSVEPTIECGLTVWHVDGKMDPKFIAASEPWNLDPKIAAELTGPCTRTGEQQAASPVLLPRRNR